MKGVMAFLLATFNTNLFIMGLIEASHNDINLTEVEFDTNTNMQHGDRLQNRLFFVTKDQLVFARLKYPPTDDFRWCDPIQDMKDVRCLSITNWPADIYQLRKNNNENKT